MYGVHGRIFLAGVAFGQASPTVILNFGRVVECSRAQAQEGYVGVAKPFPRLRGELTLIVDYQDLSGSKHVSRSHSTIYFTSAITGTAK